MDRTEALALLSNSGMNAIMTQIGRGVLDNASGYGPALDRSYAIYNSALGLSGVTDTDDAYYEAFSWLLRATTYDLVLPTYAITVDFSVDAPLASAKASQAYRALKQLRDDAWVLCDIFSNYTNVGGFKVNLDFREPGCTNGSEF